MTQSFSLWTMTGPAYRLRCETEYCRGEYGLTKPPLVSDWDWRLFAILLNSTKGQSVWTTPRWAVYVRPCGYRREYLTLGLLPVWADARRSITRTHFACLV